MDLEALTKAVNAIVPIYGLSANDEGVTDVHYIDAPSDEQRGEVRAIIDNWVDPPATCRLYKSTFVRRLSDAEAATLEFILASSETSAKLRQLYGAVEYFVSDDPLFDSLMAAVTGALGAARAKELLAAEA